MRLKTGWLTDVNPKWQVLAGNALFYERTEKSSPQDIHLTPSQLHGVLPQAEYMEITGNRVVLNLVGSDNMKHVEPNDFIIHLRSFQGGIEHSCHAGKVSNAYCVLTPKPIVYPRYYKWVLKSQAFIQELSSTTDQLRDGQSIKFEQFRAIGFPLPPIEEQRRIADYLEATIAVIQKGIGVHLSILVALKELSQSERDMNIRGKSKTRRQVDGWIGSLDASWRTIRLGQIVNFKSGAGFPDNYQGKSEGQLPFIKVGDISSANELGMISSANNFINFSEAKVLRASVAPSETIIFPKVGAALMTNSRAILGCPAVFDNNVMGLHFKEGNVRFWFHVLRAIDMGRIMNPGPVPSIGSSSVSELFLPFPDLGTQNHIAKRLDEVDSAERKLREANELAMAKLVEYRTSLITAAVTGQFDVTTGRSVT